MIDEDLFKGLIEVGKIIVFGGLGALIGYSLARGSDDKRTPRAPKDGPTGR